MHKPILVLPDVHWWADAAARPYSCARHITLLLHCCAGDAGAALMLTTIQAKPEIWSLCMTRYISLPVMMQLIEQLAANSKVHKMKGSKGSKRKSMKTKSVK